MNINSATTGRAVRAARAVAAFQTSTEIASESPAGRLLALRSGAPRRPVAMIEMSDVLLPTTGHSRQRTVSGVSLRTYAGEISNVLGSNGSAQTLLAVLAGQVIPATGTFLLGGIELKQLSDVHRRHLLTFAVGTVLPDDVLPLNGTVVDGVLAPLLAQGLPHGLTLARARVMLENLCLGGRGDALVRELSVSQERLALFARALAGGTSVLVCVQPELGLARNEAAALRQALFSAAKDGGRCVLMSTSDERFAGMADRTLWL